MIHYPLHTKRNKKKKRNELYYPLENKELSRLHDNAIHII